MEGPLIEMHESPSRGGPQTRPGDDLFFDALVRNYVERNPRFVRRGWLAEELDEQLKKPDTQFVLLTAEPGVGKTAFMAQLACDHPDWLRYFIRRDQRSALADVSDKSLPSRGSVTGANSSSSSTRWTRSAITRQSTTSWSGSRTALTCLTAFALCSPRAHPMSR